MLPKRTMKAKRGSGSTLSAIVGRDMKNLHSLPTH